jgi:toxin ParE1/3/4
VKELIVHEDADGEILDEAVFYEERSDGLGFDFILELERAYRRIQMTPSRWQKARHRTRKVTLDRFPHSVYYRELTDTIWIISVAPHARRPYYWQRRLTTPPSE